MPRWMAVRCRCNASLNTSLCGDGWRRPHIFQKVFGKMTTIDTKKLL